MSLIIMGGGTWKCRMVGLTVLTALVLIIFFPPMKGIGYQTFLGTLKDQWLPYHKWFGVVFAVLAIVGFVLGMKKK